MNYLSDLTKSFADIYLVSPRTTALHLLFLVFLLAFFVGLLVRPWRSMVIVTFVSILLGLYAFELYLGFSRPALSKDRILSNTANLAAASRGAPTDDRLMLDVVKDLRASGHDAFPTTSPTSFLLDGSSSAPISLTNIRLTKSVYCNESGTWLVFDSDRYGFNNPDPMWDQPAGTLIVGDSFAQGACVRPDESVAAVLRAKGLSALSLGIAGTGPLIQLGILKEYASSRRPKNVVWLFYEGNDVHTNLALERDSKWLRQYLQPGFTADLIKHQEESDALLRNRVNASLEGLASTYRPASFASQLKRTAMLLNTRDKLGLTSCPRRSQDFALLQDIFVEARRTVEGWGGKLTVIYLPSQHQCDLFGITDRRTNWFYDKSMSAMENAGVRVIDLKRRYHELGEPEDFYYFPGSHLTEKGYRFVADAILESAKK